MGILGGGGGVAGINFIPATEEEAYKYQYVSGELGTQWDIVLLVDAFKAYDEGRDSLKYIDPMNTSLEFCIVSETMYQGVTTTDPETELTTTEWIPQWTITHKGRDQILAYIDRSVTYEDAPFFVDILNQTANLKSNSNQMYVVNLKINEEYEKVLKDYIKLEEDRIKDIMELYINEYLPHLYGYAINVSDLDITLPKVTIGNVTRMELIQIAASIINFPYVFGGKSYTIGLPTSGLDCSGFIDWVYLQAFGKGVSSGNIPEGVSISGTAMQFYASYPIEEDELQIGDLGFYYDPKSMSPGQINHVGIYVGKINGRNAFIHAGGKYFGYDDRPNGRVGISINNSQVHNSYNNITGESFSPEMKGTAFKYFRRPNFGFLD